MVCIGLYSAVPRSGKSTGAHYLAARWDRSRVLPFAGPLKAVTDTLLLQAGLSPEKILFLRQEAKETPIPEVCDVSVRQLDQWMGTEFGRKLIHPSIWIRLWRSRVEAAQRDGIQHIIVDDLRFENEAQALKAAGGMVVAIVRSKALAEASKKTVAHASEGGLENWSFDAVVNNEGTVPEFCTKLREVVEHHA
jgi:hypothetical protein